MSKCNILLFNQIRKSKFKNLEYTNQEWINLQMHKSQMHKSNITTFYYDHTCHDLLVKYLNTSHFLSNKITKSLLKITLADFKLSIL